MQGIGAQRLLLDKAKMANAVALGAGATEFMAIRLTVQPWPEDFPWPEQRYSLASG